MGTVGIEREEGIVSSPVPLTNGRSRWHWHPDRWC